MLNLTTKLSIDKATRQSPDLSSRFTADELSQIGNYCHEGFKNDDSSRTDWKARTEAAMDLAMQISRAKNFPWPGCSNVVFPLISIAALQFSARSYSNIIQGTEVVKARVVGEDPTGELADRAERVGRHMSYQVLEQDTPWEEGHDRGLTNVSIVGFNFQKSYFSGKKNHNVSDLVLAQNLVFDYWAKSIEECARKTEIIPFYRNEIIGNCRRKVWRDVEEQAWFKSRATPVAQAGPNPSDARKGVYPPPTDHDSPFIFHEQHRWLDLDQDGYDEPYIVTYEANSRFVVRIVARWEKDSDVTRNAQGEIISITSWEYYTKYGFIPSPDGSMYDVGFGALIGPLNEAVNSGINQLIDSGTMNNSAGGFLGRGAKFKGGVYTMAPWEWKRVDATGDDLRKNLVPLMTRDPSMVLFKLLELLINYTQRLSGSTDLMQGDTPGQNTPAETSRNALEQGMQIYSTIFKRIWRSMKEEFKKLYKLNGIFLPLRTQFGDKNSFVLKEDYLGSADSVVPVADPSVTSDAQRFQRAGAVRKAAQESGYAGYDQEEVERYYLKAMRVEGVDQLYPGLKKKPPQGKDPKITIAEMKNQLEMAKLKLSQQQFQAEMSETIRLNTAQIAQLEAQALKLMADADDAKAKQHLALLQTSIDALKSHNDTVIEHRRMALEAMQMKQDQANATAEQPASE